MNKADIIREYALLRGKKQEEAKRDVETVLDIITSALVIGKPVTITGYFSMERILKEPRRYKHPATGKIKWTTPRYSIQFSTGTVLERMLNPES